MPKSFFDDKWLVQNYKDMIVKILILLNSTNQNLVDDVSKMVDLESKFSHQLLTFQEGRQESFEQLTLRDLKRNMSKV